MKDTIIAQWADYQNAKAVDVEFTVKTCFFDSFSGDLTGFSGDVVIEMADGTKQDISGEHGVNDYEDDFGFKIRYGEIQKMKYWDKDGLDAIELSVYKHKN